MVLNLDASDKKILYYLDLDARQPYSKIGRKLRLHKNVIAYRVKKLIDEGIITGFYTNIDAFRLGYVGLRFLISFQYASLSKRKEIITALSENKNTWYIAEIEGKYDFVVNFWVHDLFSFHEFWDTILTRYRDFFNEIHLSLYTKTYHYVNSYLTDSHNALKERIQHEIINSGQSISIDRLDSEILECIAINARIPYVDIARKLKVTSTAVNYRINKLKKRHIIKGYRINIDIIKLGLRYFTVNFQLRDYQKKSKIIDHIKTNLHVKMIDKAIGSSDIIVGFRAENVEQIHQFINNIQNQFTDSIKRYDYFYFLQLKKINFLPDLTYLNATSPPS